MARTGFVSGGALHELNRLTYWVALPGLLFHRIAGASPELEAVTDLLVVMIGATLAAIAAGFVAARVLRLAPPEQGSFVQGIFRGNLVFIGLPVVVYAFAESGGGPEAQASALLSFGPMVVLYNVLGVAVLLLPAGGGGRAGIARSAAYSLITNPILLACLAGLAFSLGGIGLPTVAERTLGALGQMALPLALLCIGGALHTARIRGRLGPAGVAALLKVALVPALGWLLAGWIGLSAEHTRLALILLACPTASATYVLARQLKADEGLASTIIVLSSLLALPAMIVVLALTG